MTLLSRDIQHSDPQLIAVITIPPNIKILSGCNVITSKEMTRVTPSWICIIVIIVIIIIINEFDRDASLKLNFRAADSFRELILEIRAAALPAELIIF